jgi:hypothetical protein
MDTLASTQAMYYMIGKILHEWQRVESFLFALYVAREAEFSNYRLLATTFHHIRSFETKLLLVDKTLQDHLDAETYKIWDKGLRKNLSTASSIRNNIVHGEINYDKDGNAGISPFLTDSRRYDGPTAAYWYDRTALEKIWAEWFELVTEMLRFRMTINPENFPDATHRERLGLVEAPPSGPPFPSENR